jgi:hypothetical protein
MQRCWHGISGFTTCVVKALCSKALTTHGLNTWPEKFTQFWFSTAELISNNVSLLWGNDQFIV